MKLREELIRILFILFILAVIIPAGCSKSPEDQAVSDLIEEASLLVGEAEAVREQDPAKADRIESEALARLEEAITQYPSSSLAAELFSGEIKIDRYLFAELKDAVASRAAEVEAPSAVAVAEEDEDADKAPLIRVRKLAGKPGQAYFKAAILVRLAGKYLEMDEPAPASEILAQALIFAESVEGAYFKSRALAMVAGQYMAAGEEKRASGLLAGALTLAREIEYPYFQSGALAEIVGRQTEMERYEDAIVIAGEIEDPYFKARALLEIAGRQIKAGEGEQARPLLSQSLAAVGEIDAAHFRAKALAGIAARYAAAGEGERASELLAEALELADTVDELVSRAEALSEIAGGYAVAGERERAVEVLFRANEDATKIENNLFKDLVLREIAKQYVRIDEYERALQIVETIEDTRSMALVLAAIAGRYDALGEKEQTDIFVSRTLKVAGEIKNPLFKAEVLIAIASQYRPPEPPPVEPEPESEVTPETNE